jgi:hypothetical protein
VQYSAWQMDDNRDRAASFYFYWEDGPKGQNSENPLECFKIFITPEKYLSL